MSYRKRRYPDSSLKVSILSPSFLMDNMEKASRENWSERPVFQGLSSNRWDDV